MPINIEIRESELSDFIEFYTNKKEANTEAIGRLENDNKWIEERLQTLRTLIPGSNGVPSIVYPEGYADNWVWFDKIQYIIKKAGKGLTTTEIVDELSNIEPKYKNKTERQTAVRSISATLSAKSKEGGDFTKVQNERKEFVYSLADKAKNVMVQGSYSMSTALRESEPVEEELF